MSERRDDPLQPDSVTDWAEWGRQQGSRWGKQWSGQARDWGTEVRSWSSPRDAAPQTWWSRLCWQIVSLPLVLLASALILALAVVGVAAGLIMGSLLLWMAMGLISTGIASRRGWPGQLGALLGFTLGPIGLLFVRRLPERR